MQEHKIPGNHLREKAAAATRMAYAGLFLVAVLFSPVTAYASNTGLRQGAEQAGQAAGSAVHRIGQAGKAVGLGIAHGAVEIGHAARAGAIEFWRAVKGDPGTAGNAGGQN